MKTSVINSTRQSVRSTWCRSTELCYYKAITLAYISELKGRSQGSGLGIKLCLDIKICWCYLLEFY